MQILQARELQRLFDLLHKEGFGIVGPRLDEMAIIYDALDKPEDLPVGLTDEQDKGHYRIKKRSDKAYFGYVVGPQSWKKFLHPPKRKLWSGKRKEDGFELTEPSREYQKLAFLGVRSCELQAILKQDAVFLNGPYQNLDYKSRREKSFIIAINCTEAASTCFCTSMGSGPKVNEGFDLAMTEIVDNSEHYFVLHSGTERGAKMLKDLPVEVRQDGDVENRKIQNAIAQMNKNAGLEQDGLKELLQTKLESSRWEEIAKRCLSCANCTMVCPTCFCTTVDDVTDLEGENTERWLSWDSCFNPDFSYLYGGAVRSSTASRYRQWMTHKLSTWHDQFGSSGCVGCGRCVTWCPVGIDLRDEVKAFRAEGETS